MAAHDHSDIDAGERPVVEIGAEERLHDEPSGRGEAWRVVAHDQIVVDRFRDMYAADRVVGLASLLRDDADRIAGIIAADIEEILDFVGLQDFQNFLTVFQVRLVLVEPSAEDGVSPPTPVACGLLGQIDESSSTIPRMPWSAP